MIELQLNKMTLTESVKIDVCVNASYAISTMSNKVVARLIKRYIYFDDKDYRVFLGYIYGFVDRKYYIVSYDEENHFVIRDDLGEFNDV